MTVSRRGFLRSVAGLALVGLVPYPSNSLNLNDVFISEEAYQDIRAWGVDHIDDQTTREILSSGPVYIMLNVEFIK